MLLFRPTFWLLHLLSFSLNGQIPLCQTERSSATFHHGPSSCVTWGTKLLFMKCWFLSHQPFFWIMGGWWDISILALCIHGHAPLSCPHPNWSPSTYPEDPRFFGIPRYPVSAPFLRSSTNFFHNGWAELPFFLFLYFLRYTFMGLVLRLK